MTQTGTHPYTIIQTLLDMLQRSLNTQLLILFS